MLTKNCPMATISINAVIAAEKVGTEKTLARGVLVDQKSWSNYGPLNCLQSTHTRFRKAIRIAWFQSVTRNRITLTESYSDWGAAFALVSISATTNRARVGSRFLQAIAAQLSSVKLLNKGQWFPVRTLALVSCLAVLSAIMKTPLKTDDTGLYRQLLESSTMVLRIGLSFTFIGVTPSGR